MNNEIEKFPGELRELRQLTTKLRSIVTHLIPEGAYFICGDSDDKDKMGLPNKILVCPSQGLDGFAIYTKTKDYG